MKKYNFLSFILLGITFVSCNETKKAENTVFTFDISSFKEQYQPQEAIDLGISNLNSKEVDSVIYYVNDLKVASKKGLEHFKLELKDQKLGYQNLKALVYYEGDTAEATSRVELVSNVTPKLLKYKIINKYPHDTLAFTEGLEFYKDTLYESTGQKGASYFRKLDYKTGKVFMQHDLDEQYFGEGITFINGKLYQLTWQEKTGFIYDAKTLKLEKTFTYEKDIEGWGMTNDGKYIYQTDKTEKIWKMDPATQKMIDYVNVYSGSAKIKAINELEWINGKIYTNVWQKDAIAVVNPVTGAVEGILDMSGLKKLVKNANADVLNGIAYNPKNKTIFVTGKNWDTLFEITVSE
ncbi:glutaminyl-peptide cyclotransferase [Flavobacterium muglaense]|uniref:Glutaminyl-peptide cyclotransferase n=1 Tax=Flavobacterium muglaense TaxID=2764716 RepID=A0A923N1X8_9FLAO|nr:glutaminyl-peptide cyclotransferase [Flavobacterium muglaense]MBC5839429.1 glutaminyl-peptide cyclotransferase [Flavobacterium muglaense]MBC5845941.1 glutaminyl-peptide cyclotransferase [Flavobacterium muglaense]